MNKFDATVTNIFNYAVEVFGDPITVREWMHKPVIALGGKTPLEFLPTEEGTREVENLLGRIEHGDFSYPIFRATGNVLRYPFWSEIGLGF